MQGRPPNYLSTISGFSKIVSAVCMQPSLPLPIGSASCRALACLEYDTCCSLAGKPSHIPTYLRCKWTSGLWPFESRRGSDAWPKFQGVKTKKGEIIWRPYPFRLPWAQRARRWKLLIGRPSPDFTSGEIPTTHHLHPPLHNHGSSSSTSLTSNAIHRSDPTAVWQSRSLEKARSPRHWRSEDAPVSIGHVVSCCRNRPLQATKPPRDTK
ncbi:hypothetical protein F4780DRAFT_492928 [Xylariomycetidae sp. FL0641]|nr:hypothetical protein F4780DRAFT_492928 [Xylariomycetidae sp. FL0641]